MKALEDPRLLRERHKAAAQAERRQIGLHFGSVFDSPIYLITSIILKASNGSFRTYGLWICFGLSFRKICNIRTIIINGPDSLVMKLNIT